MSLIGPRPTLRYQVDQYDERQLHRLDVKPGITGWAQIHGRATLPVGRADRARPLVRRAPLAARRPEDPAADAARALRRHLQGRDGWLEADASSRAAARGDLRLRRRRSALWNVVHYPPGARLRRGRPHGLRRRARPGRPLPAHDRRVLHAARLLRGRRARSTGSPQKLGLGDPHRAGMALNVLFLLGTVLLVGRIARELWPGQRADRPRRSRLRRAAAGRRSRRRRCSTRRRCRSSSHARALALRAHFADRRYASALGVALGAAQLVRAWALWTVAAAAIALLVGRRWRRSRSRSCSRSLIPVPWYIHQR